MSRSTSLILAVIVTTLLCLVCVCLTGGIAIWTLIRLESSEVTQFIPTIGLSIDGTPTSTPQVLRPTSIVQPTASSTGDNPDSSPMTATETTKSTPTIPTDLIDPFKNLKILEDSIVPINDPLELAMRLEGKSNLPRSLEGPPPVYQIGEERSFWITNSSTNENFQIQAALRYATEHVYFWIQNQVNYNEKQLEDLVETFEKEIYPTNRAFFGSEWTPGVDADPHLHIVYARGLGGNVAGYFSTADEYLPIVRDDSNGHEMFLLSADKLKLNNEFTYGVLAHEFQHMIHWYQDRNEESWLNEGFSELAMLLNGYSVGGADHVYVEDPDIQLTYWPTDNTVPHYGASFLFLTYFLDRFGEEATQLLVANEENGMVSIDKILTDLGIIDPLKGNIITADEVFADWVVTSYLQDANVADGRYTYNNYPSAPKPPESEEINSCPQGMVTRDVSQYGVDYIHISCKGDYSLNFEGSTQVAVLPTDPYSGSYAFFSNRGDESDMTLSHTFDFKDHSGPLTLNYWTWYDLEEDYDYLYLVASEDGETWQIVTTPSGTPDDPSGNSYGWAYNNQSGNGPSWIYESVDISQFAGKEVLLRFEYVTDAAVHGEGFLVDDIAIPEIGYFSDFEVDDGGWEAEGFVRIQNVLPQSFQLSLISYGDQTTVERISTTPDNSVSIPISIGGETSEVVLVISGTTRFTRQRAAYQFNIQP